jgi:SAM-dependent methyltransferase
MSRDPYAVFSRVYDQDVQLEIPRAFFRTLRPLIRAAKHSGPILDLGCGSGLLTEAIARAGADVIGIDASRPMLRLAAKRCARFRSRVALREARLEALRLPPRAPLALACGDVINHLPTPALVERVFRSVRTSLAPGGLFLFEAQTPWSYRTYWTDNTHLLEGPHGDLLMDCDYDPEKRVATARMIAFARDGRGRYARQETTLRESAHRDAELLRAFRRAGYAEVWRRPWSPWPDDGEPRLERNLWCGVAPGDSERPAREVLRRLGFRASRARNSALS